MLGEDVAAVGEHDGLGAVGNAVELGARACEVALGAADKAEVLQIDRHDVLHVVGRVGQCRVVEEGLQRLDQVFRDVLALPHHDVAAQVKVATGLGHLQQLLFFHAAHRELVGLDLDAGFFRELGQDLHHRVVVRMRRHAEHHRLAGVLGIAVLCLRAAEGKGGAEDGDGAGLQCASSIHGFVSWGGAKRESTGVAKKARCGHQKHAWSRRSQSGPGRGAAALSRRRAGWPKCVGTLLRRPLVDRRLGQRVRHACARPPGSRCQGTQPLPP